MSIASPFPTPTAESSASAADQAAIVVVETALLSPAVAASLQAAGLALIIVKTENEAQRLVADSVPAALILGWSAAGDPYSLVRCIREQERLAFMQVVLLTSKLAGSSRAQWITAGYDDCLDISRSEGNEIVDCILARIARAQTQAKLALLDPLTLLYNRRFMSDRLPAEIARAVRVGALLSLVLIDLDDFKQVNDTLGHTAGDRVLSFFAEALRSSFRAYDLACRFGGDEFVILLPGCDAVQAAVRLDELRARLLGFVSDPPLPAFTAGIATCPADGVWWNELFEAADDRLRRAKGISERSSRAK